MIRYDEIMQLIEKVDLTAIDDFNKKVSIPMFLYKNSAIISVDGKNINIEKDNNVICLDEYDRKSFYEVLLVLKRIESELFDLIDYSYVDYFQRFKWFIEYEDNENEFKVEEYIFSKLAIDILAVINLKFWCELDEDKKYFLNKMSKKDAVFENTSVVEEVASDEICNVPSVVKKTTWQKILNKIKNLLKIK